jgi:hypothetical protein
MHVGVLLRTCRRTESAECLAQGDRCHDDHHQRGQAADPPHRQDPQYSPPVMAIVMSDRSPSSASVIVALKLVQVTAGR